MGRAERRQKERYDRLMANKEAIKVSRSDLERYKDSISNNSVNNLFTCFALVLYEKLDLDLDGVIECLEAVDDYMAKYINGEMTMQDMKNKLKDEIGLVIKAE